MIGPEPQSQSSDSHKDPKDPKVMSVEKGGGGLLPTSNPLGVDSPTGDSLQPSLMLEDYPSSFSTPVNGKNVPTWMLK